MPKRFSVHDITEHHFTVGAHLAGKDAEKASRRAAAIAAAHERGYQKGLADAQPEDVVQEGNIASTESLELAARELEEASEEPGPAIAAWLRSAVLHGAAGEQGELIACLQHVADLCKLSDWTPTIEKKTSASDAVEMFRGPDGRPAAADGEIFLGADGPHGPTSAPKPTQPAVPSDITGVDDPSVFLGSAQ